MENLVTHMGSSLARIFGFGHMSGTGLAVWAVGMVMTMTWLIGLNQRTRRATGILGGPAFALLTLVTTVGVVFAITSMIFGVAAGLVTSSFGSIPLIGQALTQIFSSVLATLVKVFLAIFLGLHVLKNMNHLSQTVTRPFQHGYNKTHLVAGAVGLSMVINHPSISQANYFIPTILSCLLGIYTLAVVRPKWSEIKWNTEKKYVVEFGELPNGRKAKTKEDERLLREAYAEIEAYLSGDALRDEIEQKCATKKRIAAQLNLFDQKAQVRVEDEAAVSAKLAQLEAETEADVAETAAQHENARHLH